MTKWAESPYLRLNKFVQEKLRTETIVPAASQYVTDADSNDNYSLPFMIPGQEQPEMKTIYNNGSFNNLPYCVYSVSLLPNQDEPFFVSGQVTYTFHSGDMDLLFEIANYCNDLLKRDDWTAADVNNFYKADATNPFEFKYVSFITSAGPFEAEDEGGRSSFMIVVRYTVTYEGLNRIDSAIPFSGGLGMR